MQISNESDVLVKLSPAGQGRIVQHYHDQGLSPLFVKEQGYWRLPFWLVLDLFEQATSDQFFDGHQLRLANTAGTSPGGPKFWVYHCSGCRQLTLIPSTGQPKFHFFADRAASSDSSVALLKRHFLVCPNPRCQFTTYLSLEVDVDPPLPASPNPRLRARHSRPVDAAAPTRRRRSRSRA